MRSQGRAAPAFVQLAAHPLRWRLLTELAGSDYRVRELVERVGQPQNLVSYHLRLLRGGGLVTTRRSSFDARDSYYHLDLERCAHALNHTGTTLHPALNLAPTPWPPSPSPSAPPPSLLPPSAPPSSARPPARRPAVLFACTGNSARSPIAEALLRHRTHHRVEVTSAGSHPKPHIHPDAVRALREHHGIDISGQRPRHLDTLTGRRFDYVISLCDKVREVCPDFDDEPRLIHWSIPDPATPDPATPASPGAPDRAGYPAFVRTAAAMDTRIRYLLPLLALTPQELTPQELTPQELTPQEVKP